MSIVGVEKLVYGSADLAAGIKFHKDWGLDCTREDGDGADFELADGSVVEIRAGGRSGIAARRDRLGALGALHGS